MSTPKVIESTTERQHERLIYVLSAATFLIFFQVYMAPLRVRDSFLRDSVGSLALFAVLTVLTALTHSAREPIFWRLLAGIGASGVVSIALALMDDLFPYERRGHPLGWLFGAMAGGMAFGSTFGVILEPLIGW